MRGSKSTARWLCLQHFLTLFLLLNIILSLVLLLNFVQVGHHDHRPRDLVEEGGDDEVSGNFFFDFFRSIFAFILNFWSFFTTGGARCDTERCGLFGMGYVTYTGQPGTASCQESCVSFLPGQCGVCGPIVPTISPAPTASAQPSPSPTLAFFDITLDMSLVPFLDRSYFTRAAARWEKVIKGDLPPVQTANKQPSYSGCSYPSNGMVDDVFICARYAKDDGRGGTLAYAGPDGSRGNGGLPFSGYISFDEEDVQNLQDRGTFQKIVEHEFGHILGIGTRWYSRGVTGSGGSCPYLGPKGNSEYQTLTGCSQIPTELDGGSGTKCSHFDEECLKNEIMTGYINFDGSNPLSRLTIATLEDLGYEVDYSEADFFSRLDIASDCRCGFFRERKSLVETRQIHPEDEGDKSKETSQRRKLSDEMEKYAIEKGRAFLREQAKLAPAPPGSVELFPGGDEGDDVYDTPTFIGDQYVSVWVQDVDDGPVFSVTVWADDFEN